MALIKKQFSKRRGNQDYENPRSSCSVVISPNDDVIWVNDQPLDYDSLNPIFDKQCGGLLPFTGHRRLPVNNALITTKANAVAPRDSFIGEEATVAISSNYPFMSRNYEFTHNLDKTERVNAGKILTFQDTGANTHHIVSYTTHPSEGRMNTEMILLQGDDISQPTNSFNIQFGTTLVDPVNSNFDISGFFPIAVDPTSKFIYASAYSCRPNEWHTSRTTMVKIPFTTVPVDGTISIGNPTVVNLGTSAGNGRYMESSPIFYCGKNNAGETCFLTSVENQDLYAGTTGTSGALPSNANKTADGRYYFSKYNPNTETATTIADLKANEGFVGNVANATTVVSDHFSVHAPSHFEQSPIVGESDIYYGYTCGFDAANGDMSILRMKWDKANDTFAISVCSLTFNGTDTIQDFITYKQVDSDLNLSLKLNSVLTNDGNGNYYLSVFYTHSRDAVLAGNSLATERNLTTFAINSTDFTDLTYHSSTSFPALACLTQDSNCTKLLSIETSAAKYWSWTVNGFTQSASESGIFTAVSSDTDGRLWGVAYNSAEFSTLADESNVGYGTAYKPYNTSLHLISADLPASASVVFQDSSITYAGANLTKNLLVNAYDVNGSRVQKTVQLKITGNNAVFASNSGTTLTTQTSAAGDTTVALTITGAGFINVSASFTI